jgi:hypothetical protein
MFQGLNPQGATPIAQGATLYILNRKDFSISTAVVDSVSQPHITKSAQTNPALAMQGLVVDLSASIGAEPTTIEFPMNGVSANYPEKGWFVSTDRQIITNEIKAMENASKQYLAQKPWHEMVMEKSHSLLMQLSPEMQKEAQQAEEIAVLRAQIEEMKRNSSETGNKLDKVLALLAVDSPRKPKKED